MTVLLFPVRPRLQEPPETALRPSRGIAVAFVLGAALWGILLAGFVL